MAGRAPNRSFADSSSEPLTNNADVADDTAVPQTPAGDLAGASGSGARPTSGIEVFVLGNKLASPSKELPTKLRQIAEGRIHRDGWKYKFIPDTHKQTYWADFKAQAWWRPEYPESAIRRAFDISMRDSYGARIYEWKAAWRKEQKVDPTTINPIPGCVGEANWRKWTEHFDSPEEKEKSEKARTNRLSEPGGVGTGIAKHRGGSRPANRQADEIARRNNGARPENFDILLHYHQNSDGSFTDPKSQAIADEYQATLEQRRAASDQGSEVDPNEVYLQVVGNKKGRRYGLGCFGKAQKTGSSSTSSTSDVRHLQTLLETQQFEQTQLKTQFETQAQEMQQELQRQKLEMQQELDRRDQEIQRIREEQARRDEEQARRDMEFASDFDQRVADDVARLARKNG